MECRVNILRHVWVERKRESELAIVVITGGTGLIGRALVQKLRQAQSDVYLLSRNPPSARSLYSGHQGPAVSVLRYDAATAIPPSDVVAAALADADVVINRAGEPVEDGRWTPQRKEALFNSRVRGTGKNCRCAKSHAVLISASAVGYYGTSRTKMFAEDDSSGSDFLATIAAAWEQAALENRDNSRAVVFRIGVVLANGGGALEKMSMAFKAFLGGPSGGGKQWFSWVHIDDIVRLILPAAANSKWNGIYNATAPQPVRLAKFYEELGRALGRPNWLPVPRQAVLALLGNDYITPFFDCDFRFKNKSTTIESRRAKWRRESASETTHRKTSEYTIRESLKSVKQNTGSSTNY